MGEARQSPGQIGRGRYDDRVTTLRLVTWNICSGRTRAGDRFDLDLTLAALRSLDADVVALQEVDRFLPRSGNVDQAGALAAALGMEACYAPAQLGVPAGLASRDAGPASAGPASRDAGPARAGPATQEAEPAEAEPAGAGPAAPAYGIALLSRLPIETIETVRLPRGAGDEPRVAQVARIVAGGRPLTVAGTHLSYVQLANVTQLRALLRYLAGRPAPRLLVGDLNMWRPVLRAASWPRWRTLVRGRTYPNRPPGVWRPAVQLDHVLASGSRTMQVRRTRIVASPASDHRAAVVDLGWPD